MQLQRAGRSLGSPSNPGTTRLRKTRSLQVQAAVQPMLLGQLFQTRQPPRSHAAKKRRCGQKVPLLHQKTPSYPLIPPATATRRTMVLQHSQHLLTVTVHALVRSALTIGVTIELSLLQEESEGTAWTIMVMRMGRTTGKTSLPDQRSGRKLYLLLVGRRDRWKRRRLERVCRWKKIGGGE